jgi:hypothetical protein
MRQSDDDVPFARYGRATREPMSFRDECINTARLIRAEHEGDLWVPFSGGADSECVLRSFHMAGIPVNVVIVRFANGYNFHDIQYAFKACAELDQPYQLFDLDLLAFWDQEGVIRCKEVNGRWLGVSMSGWLIEKLQGRFGPFHSVPIFGNGGLLTLYNNGRYYMREREPVTALYRYLICHGRPGIPGFFQYTPEQILSWLTHPATQRFIEAKDDIVSKRLKAEIYADQFGAVVRPKYTGYEYVLAAKNSIQGSFPRSWDGSALTEYAELLRALAPRGGPQKLL